MLGTAHRKYGRKVRGRIGIYGCEHSASLGKSKKSEGLGGYKRGEDLSNESFEMAPESEELGDAFSLNDFDLGKKSPEKSSQVGSSKSYAHQRDTRRALAKRMSVDLQSMESVFLQRKNIAT